MLRNAEQASWDWYDRAILIPLAILYDLSLICLFQNGTKYRAGGDFLSD